MKEESPKNCRNLWKMNKPRDVCVFLRVYFYVSPLCISACIPFKISLNKNVGRTIDSHSKSTNNENRIYDEMMFAEKMEMLKRAAMSVDDLSTLASSAACEKTPTESSSSQIPSTPFSAPPFSEKKTKPDGKHVKRAATTGRLHSSKSYCASLTLALLVIVCPVFSCSISLSASLAASASQKKKNTVVLALIVIISITEVSKPIQLLHQRCLCPLCHLHPFSLLHHPHLLMQILAERSLIGLKETGSVYCSVMQLLLIWE